MANDPMVHRPTSSAAAAPPAISVVDDDASVRDSLGTLLDSLGFTVATYGSGSDFLADQQGRQAGCLVVDQHMPGLDGLALLAALRHDGVTIPTILITGRLDTDIAARATKLGVKAILEKPFAARQLLELVRASVEPPR